MLCYRVFMQIPTRNLRFLVQTHWRICRCWLSLEVRLQAKITPPWAKILFIHFAVRSGRALWAGSLWIKRLEIPLIVACSKTLLALISGYEEAGDSHGQASLLKTLSKWRS